MIGLGEDLLICDFAETYHIYDYKQLPVVYAAILAVGLRDNSRIKMRIAEAKGTFEEKLLSMIYDTVNVIKYYHTQDAAEGKNPPEMITPKLFDKNYKDKNEKKPEDEYMHFASGDDFKRAWNNGV